MVTGKYRRGTARCAPTIQPTSGRKTGIYRITESFLTALNSPAVKLTK